MKKQNKILFAVGILAMLVIAMSLFTGCATTESTTRGTYKTIEEAHPERISRTRVGMDINEFKQVWPEATRTGVSGNTETYQFIYTHMGTGIYSMSYINKTRITFLFTNNRLSNYESFQGIF